MKIRRHNCYYKTCPKCGYTWSGKKYLEILDVISKNKDKNITELAKIANIDRRNFYYYLKQIKKLKLVTQRKEVNSLGQQVFINLKNQGGKQK